MAPINSNWTDENGNHQGGQSTGIGYTIAWQRGPLTEGRNGAFQLEVLGSCLHQMKYFEEMNPQFACEENKRAIAGLESTIEVLEQRKARRQAEGTLGTHIGESRL